MQDHTRANRERSDSNHRAGVLPAVAIEPAFDFLSQEYTRLYDASDATAFQHPIWLDTFYRRLAAHRGAEKLVVTGRDAMTGDLLLVLPLIRRRRSGIVLLESCDLCVSDYAAPVIAPDLLDAGSLAGTIRAALPGFDIMRIRPVRPEHVQDWQSLLGGEAAKLGFSAHAAILQDDFTSWREIALEGSFRRMLDRKKKRFLKQDGAQARLLSNPQDVRTGIARLARLRAGRFDGDLIQDPQVETFYADIAVAGLTSGFARTYEIAIAGEAIGHAFGIAVAGRFNYLLIGCDYDTHGRHSPGLILYDSMIEDWIANNGKIYDFTIGDEPFKKQFGTAATPISMVSRNATWRGRLGAAAFAAREHWRKRRNTKDGTKNGTAGSGGK